MTLLYVQLMNSVRTEEDKRSLCQLLGKLYIPDEVDDDKIRTLKLLMTTLRSVRRRSILQTGSRWLIPLLQRRPLRDSVSKNAFVKFNTAIDKKFEKQLADFDEQEYRQLEYLQDLFKFLDDVTPDSDWDEEDAHVKKRGNNKRYTPMLSIPTAPAHTSPYSRSVSVVSDTTASTAASEDESAPRKANGKGKAK